MENIYKKKSNKKKIKNYYYIGVNEQYKLYIIKKIDSDCIDQITLSTWKLINIWNDVYYDYERLAKVCTDLTLNINKTNTDYILINVNSDNYPHNVNATGDIYFNTFKNTLKMMHMRYVNLDRFEVAEKELLYKRLWQLAYRSTIIDTNVVQIINEYLVSNLDIYTEIIHRTCNIPKTVISKIFNNYNIYKITLNQIDIFHSMIYEIFVVQIDDVFYKSKKIINYDTNPYGLLGMPYKNSYKPNKTYGFETFIRDVRKNRILPANYVEKNDKKTDEKTNDNITHDYKNCVLQCPADCKFKKIIMENLDLILEHVISREYMVNDCIYDIDVNIFDINHMKFNFSFVHRYRYDHWLKNSGKNFKSETLNTEIIKKITEGCEHVLCERKI